MPPRFPSRERHWTQHGIHACEGPHRWYRSSRLPGLLECGTGCGEEALFPETKKAYIWLSAVLPRPFSQWTDNQGRCEAGWKGSFLSLETDPLFPGNAPREVPLLLGKAPQRNALEKSLKATAPVLQTGCSDLREPCFPILRKTAHGRFPLGQSQVPYPSIPVPPSFLHQTGKEHKTSFFPPYFPPSRHPAVDSVTNPHPQKERTLAGPLRIAHWLFICLPAPASHNPHLCGDTPH